MPEIFINQLKEYIQVSMKSNSHIILKKELENLNIKYLENVSMKKHTTFGVGGNADIFILPNKNSQISDIIKLIKKNDVKYYFLGSGSNILITDKGIRGAIVSLKKSSKKIIFNNSEVYVDCGVMLGTLVKELNKKNIKGYESLIGVPGTVGGALFMNAGAYGSEISNNLISVSAIDMNGYEKSYSSEDLTFSYRSSSFSKNEILLDAIFKCQKGNKDTIKINRKLASNSRKEKQPLNFRSAGSIFKNPNKKIAAGLLIDKAGLKGLTIGGAQVSKKHANFIININEAKYSDVFELIEIIRKKVFEEFNVKLELEIKIIGEK